MENSLSNLTEYTDICADKAPKGRSGPKSHKEQLLAKIAREKAIKGHREVFMGDKGDMMV